MQVREAIDNAKSLNETLAVLIAAAQGVDAKQLEGMLKQADALKKQLGDLKDNMRADSAVHQKLMDENAAAFKADRDQKQKAIQELDSVLDARRKEVKAIEENHRQKLADETAAQTQTRRVQLDRLDNAIKVKTKQLEELTKAAEAYKQQVAGL